MRPWDNFFWYIEVQGLPPRSAVDPADWPPPNGTQAMKVKAKVPRQQRAKPAGRHTKAIVWLSPGMLDFQQRAIITVNNRRLGPSDHRIRADLRTLLETSAPAAIGSIPFGPAWKAPAGVENLYERWLRGSFQFSVISP